MCSGLFHIILPSLLVTGLEGDQKLGNGSFALFVFFSSCQGTLQLYFLLLKRGTPWLNGKPKGYDSSNNGNIQIYGP